MNMSPRMHMLFILAQLQSLGHLSNKMELCGLRRRQNIGPLKIRNMRSVCYVHKLGIKIPVAPIIYCDNMGAMYLCVNPIFYSRMKHIAIDYHFIRNLVQSGVLLVSHFLKGSAGWRFDQTLITPAVLLSNIQDWNHKSSSILRGILEYHCIYGKDHCVNVYSNKIYSSTFYIMHHLFTFSYYFFFSSTFCNNNSIISFAVVR